MWIAGGENRWHGTQVLQDLGGVVDMIRGETGFLDQVGLPETVSSKHVTGCLASVFSEQQVGGRGAFDQTRSSSELDRCRIRDATLPQYNPVYSPAAKSIEAFSLHFSSSLSSIDRILGSIMRSIASPSL